ncbi:MAG TPA: hypothetical protein PKD09_14005 [Aggregatilinea sp.]|uniref:hypothetical protein n=1 Tax=Aggregatilinea sp. TaxID=2806333 RepID=UPI002B887DD5|nr:hypothetical protein [Aggregatilinea sp.]HML22759.1 hypothetical protein [Aggregatilinea sp.]
MIRRVLPGLLIGLVMLLAACSGDDPTPEGDAPLLVRIDSMPKVLATVVLSETPTALVSGGEEQAVAVAQATETPAPLLPTPTLTPYVGIFLGESTAESVDGEPVPTIAPYVVNPGYGVSSGSSPVISGSSGTGTGVSGCTTPVASSFTSAYTQAQDRLGCALSGALSLQLVGQPFERGQMIWRDTSQIYALATSGQFWQVGDSWTEGMPADDPAFAAPEGRLQPVRGFGLVWRSNQSIRDALGWGTSGETPYNATWQDFERGSMLTGMDGRIYAIFPAEGQSAGPLG